jgi:hypothetical protein
VEDEDESSGKRYNPVMCIDIHGPEEKAGKHGEKSERKSNFQRNGEEEKSFCSAHMAASHENSKDFLKASATPNCTAKSFPGSFFSIISQFVCSYALTLIQFYIRDCGKLFTRAASEVACGVSRKGENSIFQFSFCFASLSHTAAASYPFFPLLSALN